MQCDAWALGMCLHVMLCGCFPFDSSQEEEELLRSINAAEFSFSDPGWKALSADALDMVSSLLNPNSNPNPSPNPNPNPN